MNRNISLTVKISALTIAQCWLINKVITIWNGSDHQVHDVLWMFPIIVIPFLILMLIQTNIRVGDYVNVYYSTYGPLEYKRVESCVKLEKMSDRGFVVDGKYYDWFNSYMTRVYKIKK